MNNKNTDYLGRLINVLTAHPWLKLLSLILAVIIWFYAKEEIGRFN